MTVFDFELYYLAEGCEFAATKLLSASHRFSTGIFYG
jgi:hypothetical protein